MTSQEHVKVTIIIENSVNRQTITFNRVKEPVINTDYDMVTRKMSDVSFEFKTLPDEDYVYFTRKDEALND